MVHLPIYLEPTSGTTLQERIYNGIRNAVLAHQLALGSRLPSSRELAESIAVSRNTVVLAYDRLAAEGYVELKSGVGTFVTKNLPEQCLQADPMEKCEIRPRRNHTPCYPTIAFFGQRPAIIEKGAGLPSIDFWYGRADQRVFPMTAWRRIIAHNLGRAAANMIEYPPTAGLPELRQAIAKHVAYNRGINVDWRNVIITGGAQEAFDIIAKLFVKLGTRVAVESPCYQGLAFTLRAHGAVLIPIPVDSEGMNIDHLERQSEVALVCATPSHQFPTGETLTLERRFRMLRWAEQIGAYIVEDDYDGDFRFSASPLPAMVGLDGAADSVLYVGTFSKSLGAGLRRGFMIVPDRVLSAAVCAKALATQGEPWLDQVVLAEFLESGAYRRHLRRLRQSQMQSRDALLNALTKHFGAINVSGTDAGMHLMWRLPPNFPEARDLAGAARKLDVGIYPPSAAGAELFGEPEQALLFGYPALTEIQIAEGICRLKRALDRIM
jgi:GntR family transcriptional regulator/MocR family aminotransferase